MQMRDQARELVGKMTLEEKISQLHSLWLNIGDDGKLTMKSLNGYHPEVGSQDPFEFMKNGIGQITRPLGSQDIDPVTAVRELNRIQHFLVNNTRLGIPALPHEECLAGLMAGGATIFPAGINNGSTWDEDLIERVGSAIGEEVYSVGSRQGLSPVLDVCRDARWGRTEETFGEDPYLAAILGSAYVRGLQDSRHPVIATLKHYAGHSFSEGARNHAPVRIGRRELNDLFLFPFEMAVKYARAGSIMPAYHDIDGEPLHQSKELLGDLLRGRWGFEGILVSDYGGLEQLVTDHRTQPDKAHAAAASLLAGMDVELPANTLYPEGIPEALKQGLISISDVDEAVTRHLIQKIKAGLFSNPYTDEALVLSSVAEHEPLALEAAEKSMVLIKNDGILPLKGAGKIALIGPLADDTMGMMGGYSFPIHLIIAHNKDKTSQIQTLKGSLEASFDGEVLYAKGCDVLISRPDKPAVFPGDIVADGSMQTDFVSRDTSRIAEAVATAKRADTVVLAVGDLAGLFLSGTVGEGSDVSSLTLPGVQQELIDAVLELGKPTVIVVFSGRPYHLGKGFRKAGAVLQAWLPGQKGAAAASNVLLGRTNPGGKLPVSIPRCAGAMPYFYNHKMKSAGTPIQKDFGAEYPFGHGCSYTNFLIESCELTEDTVPVEGSIQVSAQVKNIGDVQGDEVIQVYTRDLYARYVRPIQELKAFQRITLAPGESCRVSFNIPTDLVSYTIDSGNRIVEPGDLEIMVGTSSKDIVSKLRVTLTGQPRILGEDWRMKSLVTISK
ncbi:glycoside hydrolase family 3 N-terminal domain-containing protein [Oceanispirochaeta sp.]|jgi:beta-glucosidase-like glycosyl hydrolase|uniref:glycoside hydrolase family 3 N-terminal domain-containing protein n=1 Tax=Oceanispirochaeta sp. TaxID=2035350 RepID=UPI00262447DC|nr:glycoside hydrolase family 3 N-terminal domain-containing protein [Oceanispirochaeta sp.]MDA3956273.1 glycoside hydrolase family 3 C-terminal domain-containing protein [Oceanispirochaeta sp.]